jgi:HSP20 family molecular chaperone IbpA
VLADGIEVKSADLTNGLLAIDLQRLEPDRLVRRIEIGATSRIKSLV